MLLINNIISIGDYMILQNIKFTKLIAPHNKNDNLTIEIKNELFKGDKNATQYD